MTSPIDYAMSREEVAAELGISRSRVEQLEKNALRKLTYKFKPYLDGRGDWEAKYDRLYRALSRGEQFTTCSKAESVGREK